MQIAKKIDLLPQMAIFAKVADLGSFKAVADLMVKSPSTITRAIQDLEDAFGVPLLNRRSDSFGLTDAGHAMIGQCRLLLHAVDSAELAVTATTPELTGTLHIAASAALLRWVVQPHMADFLRAHPQLYVQAKVVPSDGRLSGNLPDVMVMTRARQPPELQTLDLLPMRYLLCATPAYLARHGAPGHPSQLAQHNCLHYHEDQHDSDWRFVLGDEVVNHYASSHYGVSNNSVLYDAMLNDIGIACLPEFAVDRLLDVGYAHHLLPDWTLTTHYSGIATLGYRPDKLLRPKVQAFLDHMQTAVARARALPPQPHHPLY
jgi:DNA-binding transcriptional LysR family regulator